MSRNSGARFQSKYPWVAGVASTPATHRKEMLTVPNQEHTSIQVNGQWILEQLSKMNENIAVLPSIAAHLDRINGTIAKNILTVEALDVRVTAIDMRVTTLERLSLDLHRIADYKEARWKSVLSSVTRVVEALLIAFLVSKVLGLT